jgi:hypothetical protein
VRNTLSSSLSPAKQITRRGDCDESAGMVRCSTMWNFRSRWFCLQSHGGRRGQSYPSSVQFSSGSFEHAVGVLADRLWPGGLSRQIDLWLKQIAPNDAVRRRFHREAAAKSDLVTVILLLLSRPRRGRPL